MEHHAADTEPRVGVMSTSPSNNEEKKEVGCTSESNIDHIKKDDALDKKVNGKGKRRRRIAAELEALRDLQRPGWREADAEAASLTATAAAHGGNLCGLWPPLQLLQRPQ